MNNKVVLNIAPAGANLVQCKQWIGIHLLELLCSLQRVPPLPLQKSTNKLDTAVTPEELLAIPTDELCAILKKASRGRFGEAKAEEIRTAAQNSFDITIAPSAFVMQLRQLLEMIDLLERQLDELDFEIEQRMNKLNTCITHLLRCRQSAGRCHSR